MGPKKLNATPGKAAPSAAAGTGPPAAGSGESAPIDGPGGPGIAAPLAQQSSGEISLESELPPSSAAAIKKTATRVATKTAQTLIPTLSVAAKAYGGGVGICRNIFTKNFSTLINAGQSLDDEGSAEDKTAAMAHLQTLAKLPLIALTGLDYTVDMTSGQKRLIPPNLLNRTCKSISRILELQDIVIGSTLLNLADEILELHPAPELSEELLYWQDAVEHSIKTFKSGTGNFPAPGGGPAIESAPAVTVQDVPATAAAPAGRLSVADLLKAAAISGVQKPPSEPPASTKSILHQLKESNGAVSDALLKDYAGGGCFADLPSADGPSDEEPLSGRVTKGTRTTPATAALLAAANGRGIISIPATYMATTAGGDQCDHVKHHVRKAGSILSGANADTFVLTAVPGSQGASELTFAKNTNSYKGAITLPQFIQGHSELSSIYLSRVNVEVRPALSAALAIYLLHVVKLHELFPQPEMLVHLQAYEEAARQSIFDGKLGTTWTTDNNFGAIGCELNTRYVEVKIASQLRQAASAFRPSNGGGGGNNGGARAPARGGGLSVDRMPNFNTYCRNFNKPHGCNVERRGLTCGYPHICSNCFSKEHSANTCTQRGDGPGAGPTDGGVGRRGVSFGAGTKQ